MRATGAALALLLLFPTLAAASGSEHGEEKPAAAAPAAAPPPEAPPPPPPRRHEPPPVLHGPIAAPAPTPRIPWLADPTTGLALGGYDPVAYFLRGGPTLGSREHEYEWGGTTWRFVDEGTLAAFRAAPEAYAPLFGGRCAFAVSQGRPADASPHHFLIHRGRLLFFADPVARAAFLEAPDRLLAEAERRWPALLADLP